MLFSPPRRTLPTPFSYTVCCIYEEIGSSIQAVDSTLYSHILYLLDTSYILGIVLSVDITSLRHAQYLLSGHYGYLHCTKIKVILGQVKQHAQGHEANEKSSGI